MKICHSLLITIDPLILISDTPGNNKSKSLNYKNYLPTLGNYNTNQIRSPTILEKQTPVFILLFFEDGSIFSKLLFSDNLPQQNK